MTALAVVIVIVMTTICILGTELSARVQNVMILAQIGSLLLFAIVAIVKVYSGDATVDSIEPQASWFNPFEIDEPRRRSSPQCSSASSSTGAGSPP